MSVFIELEKFYSRFSGDKGIIGFSAFNKPIRYFKVEKTGFPVVIVQCAMHAREYVTTYLAIEQIKWFNRYGKKGTVYFIPLVNPDGVEIVEKVNRLYKANGNGVDLNVNFDARWGTGESNVFVKGEKNYVGEFAFSEPESRALKDFTLFVKPDATVSYHSKGEEIYWRFFQEECLSREYYLARALGDVTGYALKETPNSAGGYKDWCIEKLKIPAFTIEVGDDKLVHPIGKERTAEIFTKNKGVIKTLIKGLSKINGKIYEKRN